MWKECKINNLYIVSTDGIVKRKNTNKILSQKLDKDNYLSVNLSMGGRGNTRQIFVHRLVAETFLPNPDRKPQVNHKDGDKLNNRVNNLEWNTCLENVQHSIYTGLRNDKGCSSKRARFKESDIKWIRQHYKPNDSKYGCTALSKKFKVGKATISDIINHKIYKNIGE